MEHLFRTFYGTVRMEEPILVFMRRAEKLVVDEPNGILVGKPTNQWEVVFRNEEHKHTAFTGIRFYDYYAGLKLLDAVREMIKRAGERGVRVIELEVSEEDERLEERLIDKLLEANPELK